MASSVARFNAMASNRSSHLDRRQFISTTAAVGAAFLTGCAGTERPTVTTPNTPCPESSTRPYPGVDLQDLTISDLQGRLGNGQETSRSLVEKYMARIEAMNFRGLELRAVLELNPEALEIAEELDRERAAKGPRGALHGIPILLKDNIDTADKMTTTAGSLALSGSIPQKDSTVATRLRDAGAILLGKTNMSEWANFRSSHSTSGWSSRGGQCRNPYVLDRTPSGSSSGSGAAIAASFAAAAIGTETDGSIISPSSCCSLVGIKPTLGLISRAGIIPISPNQDTAGPMARTVMDAAILLGVLVAADPRDPSSSQGAQFGQRDYVKTLGRRSMQGLRVGVMRKDLSGKNSKVDAVFEEALKDLKFLGMELVDPADVPSIADLWPLEKEALLHEFKPALEGYLATLSERAPIKTMQGLIAWNDKHRDETMPFFDQDLLLEADKRGDLTNKAYLEVREKLRDLSKTRGLDPLLDGQKLDALVAPSSCLPWPIDLASGDYETFSAASPPAIAGYPHITVPAGYCLGLPVGISFIGKAWSESLLLDLAYAYEQATKARRTPRYLPSVETTLKR